MCSLNSGLDKVTLSNGKGLFLIIYFDAFISQLSLFNSKEPKELTIWPQK